MRLRFLAALAAAPLMILTTAGATPQFTEPRTGTMASAVAPAAPKPLSCDDGTENEKLCMFDDPDWKGNVHFIGSSPDRCVPDFGGYRSYRNEAWEGYVYESADCSSESGRAKAVLPNSDNPDVGFAVHSVKESCVRCREGER